MKTAIVKIKAEFRTSACTSMWNGKERESWSCEMYILGQEVGSTDFVTFYATEESAIRAAKKAFKENQAFDS